MTNMTRDERLTIIKAAHKQFALSRPPKSFGEIQFIPRAAKESVQESVRELESFKEHERDVKAEGEALTADEQ